MTEVEPAWDDCSEGAWRLADPIDGEWSVGYEGARNFQDQGWRHLLEHREAPPQRSGG